MSCFAQTKVETVHGNPDALLPQHELIGEGVEAPLAFCSATGEIESATPTALRLLQRLGVLDELPTQLPATLWNELSRVRVGDAIDWQPPQASSSLLGCTRYPLQQGGYLLLMREVSDKQAALSEQLQRQRVESTGRLIASIAHDVRSSVASIVYGADFLEARQGSLTHETLQATVRDIADASRRLQLTVDGLLDYARLGPAISVSVSLREVLSRTQGLLRSFYRDSAQRLRLELPSHDCWVRGNPVVVEQVFANLLLTLVAANEVPAVVSVSSRELTAGNHNHPGMIEIRVQVVEANAREHGVEPGEHARWAWQRPSFQFAFADAQAAAESQGGSVSIEPGAAGTSFSVRLPRSEGPR
ncbi:MAG TPA: histidine kinase dimerization/phospho-acceptor domain-containing protein [Polyangiales bacterium]